MLPDQAIRHLADRVPHSRSRPDLEEVRTAGSEAARTVASETVRAAGLEAASATQIPQARPIVGDRVGAARIKRRARIHHRAPLEPRRTPVRRRAVRAVRETTRCSAAGQSWAWPAPARTPRFASSITNTNTTSGSLSTTPPPTAEG